MIGTRSERRAAPAIVALSVLCLLSSSANASIIATVGTRDFSDIVATDDFLTGNCIFKVCNRSGFISSMPSDSSRFFAQTTISGVTGIYQSGGAASMTSIRLNILGRDGFGQFQFDVSNGIGNGTGDPQYVWVRTYNDGVPTGTDFEFDVLRPSTLTIWSTGASVFDEVRVQSYGEAALRDLNLETIEGAVIVGGFVAGDAMPIPEPSTALLVGLGLGALSHRRRSLR